MTSLINICRIKKLYNLDIWYFFSNYWQWLIKIYLLKDLCLFRYSSSILNADIIDKHIMWILKRASLKKIQDTCELNPSDQFISSNVVEIHHHHIQRAFSDLLPWYIEGEYLVEYWIQCAFEDRGLAFLDPLVAKLQPHLDIRIWKLRILIVNIIESLILLNA